MIETITRDRLVALLAAATDHRIAIVGDAMLDVYLHGEVDRISPEAPVPVVRVTTRRRALGGAANVAQNVAAIGAQCELVAAIGNDDAGRTVARMLREIGTEARGILQTTRPTTVKTRVVARSQQMVRFDEEDDRELSAADATRLAEAVHAAVAAADAIVLEDYNKGVLVPSVIRAAIDAANAREIPVVVDPKYRNFFAYSGATIFKPNKRELEAALGAEVDLEHPEALPASLRRLGVEHLLLTIGDEGMVLLSDDGEVGRVPTTAREVYDVVGAGDTVTAYLATMLAAGASPAEAAVVANYAAGVEVGKLGAATVSTEEVLDAFDAYHERRGVIA
jgi:rfaE bifunctional protein kinase chain/domain